MTEYVISVLSACITSLGAEITDHIHAVATPLQREDGMLDPLFAQLLI